jgi:hypothetical protein
VIYRISLGPLPQDEEFVRDHLKRNNFKKVLDLGGVQRPWARPYVTHYVDLMNPGEWANRYPEMKEYEGFWDKEFIYGSIENHYIWDILKEQMPFDFVICSQTLEHVSNPSYVLDQIQKIAPEGFISIPHKLFELRKGIHWGQPFRGALPHKWISVIRPRFDKDNIDYSLRMYPKLSFIDYMKFDCDGANVPIPDLSFWWLNYIPYEIIGDECLDFPDPKEAIDFYRKELNNGGIYG